MTRAHALVAALALASPLTAHAAPSGFGWFAELAGSCWSGTFPDGKTQHAQCYTVQFDRFLRGTATLPVKRDGRAQTSFERDSLFAWDESRRRIVYYI